jgi:hypothetical protein
MPPRAFFIISTETFITREVNGRIQQITTFAEDKHKGLERGNLAPSMSRFIFMKYTFRFPLVPTLEAGFYMKFLSAFQGMFGQCLETGGDIYQYSSSSKIFDCHVVTRCITRDEM